ncbi:MAG TPA: PilT/PilU family type 4a pilus ATPase [Kineosporiaceae bacterium]|nr:PilT/PilU family type 4a pilus ATPase [Kineosporiaceae bacterium]
MSVPGEEDDVDDGGEWYPEAQRPAAPPYVPERFAFEDPDQAGAVPAVAPAMAPAPSGYPGTGGPGEAYPDRQAYLPSPSEAMSYPGQSYPGQSYPGQSYPGQEYPAQPYPGQPYPGAGQPEPGYPAGGSPDYPPSPAAPPAPTAPRPPSQRVPPAGPGGDPYQRATTEQRLAPGDLDLGEVLGRCLAANASDVHVTAGSPPLLRINGELVPVPEYEPLEAAMLQRVLYAILTQHQRERFEEELELDLSYTLPGQARFRVNLYRQKEALGAAFRRIPYEIKSLEQLGMPPTVANFASLPRGMVLVTGPTGSGKSTTLAAIIDLANRTRHDHIITVEDPIEFLHQHKSCMVNQREVGADTHSFANALKHALRQDPDIILVGEMRDLETISVALTAAETGHLVFATLHTQDAAQTIDRVIDVFPPHQQQQVRVQLAGTLQGVVCQTLCKTTDGKSRVAATEVMVATPAIRNLIREGKTHQVYSSLQAGGQHGMHTLDQHLAELVRGRAISYEMGVEKCHHIEDYNRLCGRG